MCHFSYHTHTTFCDGKNSPMEMAEAAVRQGITALGFSGHSYSPLDPQGTLPQDATPYRQAVEEVRRRFAGTLEVFCGVEQDLYSPGDGGDFEYAIGSVHCLRKGDIFCSIDLSPQHLRQGVKDLYDGNPYAMAEDYYQAVATLPDRTAAKIVGHFDLITKFLGKDPLFDPLHPRYLEAAYAAMDRLISAGMIFEINTGNSSRDWRTPSPHKALLRYLRDHDGRITLGTDSHRADTVGFGLDLAVRLARETGFSSISRFDGKIFEDTAL